ncbi:MAG TPA: tRNA pseudouridine(55) synthase TruB [Burkholderiales bacterium]
MTGSASPKIARRRVDGVLLLDKPHGMSSNMALQKARRLYAAERAGHSGTLDPLATGLLPVLFGEATKFGSELLDGDKRYLAEVAFGVCTTTGDAEGDVVSTRPVEVSLAQLEAAVQRFIGPIRQVPPMYSALKHAGRPLYHYARAGQHIERAAREVTIHALRIEAFDGKRAVLNVHCSKGTYIRTLGEDLGEALGCGAHLAGLRRTGAGPFSITDALTLENLEQLAPEQRDAKLLPVDLLVQHLPRLDLSADQARRLNMGQALADVEPITGRVRAYLGECFLGVAERDAAGVLRARRLLRTGA